MLGIGAIIALFTVLLLSLVITRVATVALTLTGLSEEAARFQARSAFTGVGFTTSESEGAVNHPVRRRIVMLLMILHSAGLASVVVSLLLAFAQPGDAGAGPTALERLLYLVVGLLVLWVMARSRLVDRWMRRIITRALKRWTDLDVRDYAALLRLSGDYAIIESQVRQRDWIAGKTLLQCNLLEEGIIVLGIRRRDGTYVGSPRGSTSVEAGDTLLLYGRRGPLENLDRREAGAPGEVAHWEMAREEERRRRQDEERARREREAADSAGRTDSDTETG